jgi:FkbM family methyltransferase
MSPPQMDLERWGAAGHAKGDITSKVCARVKVINQSGVKFPMCLHANQDIVSDAIASTSKVYCDGDLVEHFQKFNRRGIQITFLDIGSNIGSCAILAAALGHIAWAFEPLPQNLAILQKTIEMNHNFGGRLHLVKCGASNKRGSFDIYTLPYNWGHSTLTRQARLEKDYVCEACCTVLVDDVAGKLQVDLMKLDVEGHELFALEGASSMFSNASRAPLFINFEHYGPTTRDHSSGYWTVSVYKFFASQSQHKYKIIIFFSRRSK